MHTALSRKPQLIKRLRVRAETLGLIPCSAPDLICSFILLANNYLLSTYYVLGTWDTRGHNKLDSITGFLGHKVSLRGKPS